MIDVQNILDCRAAVEAEIGPVQWREVTDDNQVRVSWLHNGKVIDPVRIASAAANAKRNLVRIERKPLAASLGLEIVKAEHAAWTPGETIAVLRVSFA